MGMVGGASPAAIGAAQAAATGLIGAMPAGGAEVIASRGAVSAEDEMLDRAAMESGTD
jgi:argininosuccinate synthase